MQHSTTEQRCADYVLCRTCVEGIEAESREDVPSRHLSAVVIACITAWRGIIELAAHLLDKFLCTPRLASEVIKIDCVVTWFVAVRILTNEAAGIAIHFAARLRKREVLVKLLDERLHTAKEVDESLRVLRHKPHVLPGVTLHEARLFVTEWVERLNPVALVVLRLEEARSGVEEVTIKLAALDETLVVGLLAEFLCNGSHAPVVEGLFHSDGHADVLLVLRHVAALLPNLERTVRMRASAALDHSLVGTLDVESRQFRQDSICYDGYCVVAYHAVVVLPPQIPDGQIAVGLMMQDHIADELHGNLRIEQGVERVGSTEGVPEAEGAVIALTSRHLLDFEVGVHVAAINVADGVGLHEDMIETGVEDGLLVVGAFDVDSRELFLPSIVSGFGVVIEVPRLRFRLHILASSVVING